MGGSTTNQPNYEGKCLWRVGPRAYFSDGLVKKLCRGLQVDLKWRNTKTYISCMEFRLCKGKRTPKIAEKKVQGNPNHFRYLKLLVIPSLKLTFCSENGCLEYDRFLLGPDLFSGAIVVLGSVSLTDFPNFKSRRKSNPWRWSSKSRPCSWVIFGKLFLWGGASSHTFGFEMASQTLHIEDMTSTGEASIHFSNCFRLFA